jgi:hypothetical protein
VLAAAGYHFQVDDDELAVDAAAEQVGELAAAHRIPLHRLNPTAGLEAAFFRLTEQPGLDAAVSFDRAPA